MDLPTPALLAELRHQGYLSFARFMELALYEPGAGYYERDAGRVGKHGDYYTNVSVGSLFGELLAARIAAWLAGDKAAGRIDSGQRAVQRIVEAGAHDGRLARDILAWLGAQRSEVCDRVDYWILEPSPARRRWQQETLAEFTGKVQWAVNWSELGEVDGVMFCNELLDAMPVHRLVWSRLERQWQEAVVVERQDGFSWSRVESNREFPGAHHLEQLPRALLEMLPDGFVTEVSPAAARWWTEAATALKWGRLVTFDYGLDTEEFLDPGRSEGTLRAYHNHKLSEDVLANPGQQDLTAHVDFTMIRAAGEHVGLRTEIMEPQSLFLSRVATQLWPGTNGTAWTPTRIRQFQTLTHPQHLGHSFRVLVQRRAS